MGDRILQGLGRASLGLIGLVVLASCSDASVPAAPTGFAGPSEVGDRGDPDPTDDPPPEDPPPEELPGCSAVESELDAEGDHNGGSVAGVDFDVLYPFPITITAAEGMFAATTNENQSSIRIAIDAGLGNDDDGVWSLTFESNDGSPLAPNVVYPVDDREIDPRLSRLNVTADVPRYPAGVERCAPTCGAFEINELVIDQGVVQRFAASFDQQCRCDPASFTGCISFVR